MAQWIGAQGLVKLVKNFKNFPICDATKRKLHTQFK